MKEEQVNQSRWWVPPQTTVWVLMAFLAGTLLIIVYPPAAEVLALHSPLFGEPLNFLRVATFSLVHIGVAHWLYVAGFTVLAALALKGRMDERWMVAALLVGGVTGGVAFGLLSSEGVMAGGHVAGWGLAGAAVGSFARIPNGFRGWRLAYVLLLLMAAAGLAVGGSHPPFPLVAAGLAGALVGFAATDSAEEVGAVANTA